jgi:hypothetical protein
MFVNLPIGARSDSTPFAGGYALTGGLEVVTAL